MRAVEAELDDRSGLSSRPLAPDVSGFLGILTRIGRVEAEGSNHDTLRAVPKDFDTMAAHGPEAAILVVKNRERAHDMLEAVNDPPEGEPRVEKEYNAIRRRRSGLSTRGS
jgi:hypothetical protein